MMSATYLYAFAVLFVIVAAGCTPAQPAGDAEEAHSEPFIVANSQAVEGSVLVSEAFLDKPGYIVIHKAVDGSPGPVVGSSGLLEGDLHEVSVAVSGTEDESELIAMLHYDDGDSAYEFPGDDAPVAHDEGIVIAKFAVESGAVTTEVPVPGNEGVEEVVVEDLGAEEEEIVEFDMVARQWEFTPRTITVKEGSRVRLSIESVDVAHGFGLPDFGVNEYLSPGETTVVEFVADERGTYTFFCSVQCGAGHPNMRGTLVVE